MSIAQDPLIQGSLQRVLHARQNWIEAKKAERKAEWLFNDAAADFLRSFGEQYEDDITSVAHVIGDMTITVEDEWYERPEGMKHLALTFYRTSSYAPDGDSGEAA
ncbi:MAG: hypothetical protein AB9873_17795 [Syntrophobacteraceae bacterium]